MTSRDFCYWLQGYFELLSAGHDNTSALTDEQGACIRKHLAMVFVHEIDPSFGKDNEKLSEIHNKPAPTKPTKPAGLTAPHPYSAPDPHQVYKC